MLNNTNIPNSFEPERPKICPSMIFASNFSLKIDKSQQRARVFTCKCECSSGQVTRCGDHAARQQCYELWTEHERWSKYSAEFRLIFTPGFRATECDCESAENTAGKCWVYKRLTPLPVPPSPKIPRISCVCTLVFVSHQHRIYCTCMCVCVCTILLMWITFAVKFVYIKKEHIPNTGGAFRRPTRHIDIWIGTRARTHTHTHIVLVVVVGGWKECEN